MPSKEELFELHVTNLLKVCPDVGRVFKCPICFRDFPFEAIAQKEVDRGHIWPDSIRAKCEEGERFQVLLCKRCNSKSGDHGDKAMQEFEAFLESLPNSPYQLDSIRPYNPHIVIPPETSEQEPIEMRGDIEIEPGNVNINWGQTAEKRKKRNNPKHYQRFVRYFSKANDLVIKPGRIEPSKVYLAQLGWLTGAYLFAFYIFGYRYAMQPFVEQLRRQILGSFEFHHKKLEDFSPLPNVFTLSRFFDNPELITFLRYGSTRHQLQVNFLYTGVELPLVSTCALPSSTSPNPDEIGRYFRLETNPLWGDTDYWQQFFGNPSCLPESTNSDT